MTVMSGVFRARVEAMKVPRVLMTRHVMGRPISAPHDVERQRHVLTEAFSLLERATEGSTFVELLEPYRTAPVA